MLTARLKPYASNTVSYTHLDVYKRQQYDPVGFLFDSAGGHLFLSAGLGAYSGGPCASDCPGSHELRYQP